MNGEGGIEERAERARLGYRITTRETLSRVAGPHALAKLGRDRHARPASLAKVRRVDHASGSSRALLARIVQVNGFRAVLCFGRLERVGIDAPHLALLFPMDLERFAPREARGDAGPWIVGAPYRRRESRIGLGAVEGTQGVTLFVALDVTRRRPVGGDHDRRSVRIRDFGRDPMRVRNHVGFGRFDRVTLGDRQIQVSQPVGANQAHVCQGSFRLARVDEARRILTLRDDEPARPAAAHAKLVAIAHAVDSRATPHDLAVFFLGIGQHLACRSDVQGARLDFGPQFVSQDREAQLSVAHFALRGETRGENVAPIVVQRTDRGRFGVRLPRPGRLGAGPRVRRCLIVLGSRPVKGRVERFAFLVAHETDRTVGVERRASHLDCDRCRFGLRNGDPSREESRRALPILPCLAFRNRFDPGKRNLIAAPRLAWVERRIPLRRNPRLPFRLPLRLARLPIRHDAPTFPPWRLARPIQPYHSAPTVKGLGLPPTA